MYEILLVEYDDIISSPWAIFGQKRTDQMSFQQSLVLSLFQEADRREWSRDWAISDQAMGFWLAMSMAMQLVTSWNPWRCQIHGGISIYHPVYRWVFHGFLFYKPSILGSPTSGWPCARSPWRRNGRDPRNPCGIYTGEMPGNCEDPGWEPPGNVILQMIKAWLPGG